MARENTLRAWMGKRNSYHPSELPPHIHPPTNEERGAVELFDWHANPPDRYFCYPSDDLSRATTWMGGTLGTLHVGSEWRSNMGDKRRHVRVFGTNGKIYAGTLFETFIRMRAVKR